MWSGTSSKTGKRITRLNPAEKFKKFNIELKHGRAITNDAKRKYDKNGKPVYLTDSQKSWRAGYIASTMDSARAFKSKHPRYKRKTS